MLKFIFSKIFLMNIILALVLFVLGGWLVSTYLNKETKHAETITVPDVSAVKTTEIEAFLAEKGFSFQILDSVYYAEEPKGVVLEQEPKAGAKVKEGRTIYLTVNAKSPPKISMPDLTDRSMKMAVALLESYGLKLGKVIYSSEFCPSCVLSQQINGDTLKAGTLIRKGTVIDLVLGVRDETDVVAVPHLLGLKIREVEREMRAAFLNIGTLSYEDCFSRKDSLNATVYRQSTRNKQVRITSKIDLWFSTDQTKVDTTSISLPDSLQTENTADEMD